MKRTTVGIDFAKQVFELYLEDGAKPVVQRKRLTRLGERPTTAAIALSDCP